ncbi:MAG: class I SAM-dependent methyltransferase [Spirochaetales bacterium]|nr:class I SAM-dependent methyltransferase [Spirochaetales bacterium]
MKNNEMETIGSRPTGFLGKIAGKLMNTIHSSAYKKIIDSYIIRHCGHSKLKTALDIGCGGGVAVKLLSDIDGIKKTIGVDYSDDMVNLSRDFNKKGIAKGIVEIQNADVSALPFEDNYFDIITAFDTINFWPDHKKAISEIKRTLKENGAFFIINAYPKEGTKWHEFVKFKSDIEYKDFLGTNGLKDVQSVIEKNTVIVWGLK